MPAPLNFRFRPDIVPRLSLILAGVSIAVIWCAVLPWYANTEEMQQQLEFLDDRGIDPSAMFYTELEAMDGILNRTGVR